MRRPALTRPTAALRPTGARAAVVVATVVALAGSALVATPDRASAATYPSWDDVLAARGKESATTTKVTELQGLLDGLRDDAEAAQAEAQRLGTAFQQASADADEAARKEQTLRDDAAEHTETAEQSAAQAGRFAAQIARSGGGSVTASLLADGDGARDLLYDLGALSKLTEQSEKVGAQATADAAVASSLTAQADRAANELGRLAGVAEDRMADAQAASDAASTAVAAQESNEARLQAQLATLTSGRVRTEAEFRTGEKKRQEAIAAAAAEAARRAAEEAAKQQAGSGGGSGGGTPPGGSGGSGGSGGGSGWVRPGSGYLISAYGYRVHPITGVVTFHAGIDLAAGCYTPIVAASAGTVDYVGWFGGYGNYVRIRHADGTKTAYGHIVNGGYRVSSGQRVSAGQLVALVGSTGQSTGCHLHFETHVGGNTTNPVPFMAARGVGF